MAKLALFTVMTLVAALAVVVQADAPDAQATEVSSRVLLVKRVQDDGTARWERVEARAYSSLSAADRSDIIAVSEDAVFTEFSAPNDPLYDEQWNFPQIDVEGAWLDATGSGIVVAVVDSGLDPSGPDLACRSFVHPFSAFTFGETMADVAEGTGHGTHVTGTVGQCTDNSYGVAGVARDVTIMPVKVLNDSGTGTADQIANGIAHAVEHGADVINLSLGMECGGSTWPACSIAAVDLEIEAAIAAGITVVASSGNAGGFTVGSPANHPDVIAVGATHSGGTRASYSNRGSALDVMAPGGDTIDRDLSGQPDLVWQERPDSGGSPAIIGMFGTSMAAPHVSGTVALMLEANPSWSPLKNRCVLIDTATDLGTPGFDTSNGWGLIDAAAAVSHTGESYTDVIDEWFLAAVDHVTDEQIAQGYDDCTFRPNADITRAEAVTMLVRAQGASEIPGPTAYSDVPASSPFAGYINAAHAAGWITGYPDGTFGPDDPITRAEFAAIAARAWAPGTSPAGPSPFPDVEPGDWFHDVVVVAYELGAIDGFPDGTYRPADPITRAESAQVFFNLAV